MADVVQEKWDTIKIAALKYVVVENLFPSCFIIKAIK